VAEMSITTSVPFYDVVDIFSSSFFLWIIGQLFILIAAEVLFVAMGD
jgi:hypothetical protein